ncbi:uncharacterized protein LOC133530682 [Cydia pomonella]|uniref:uncharacterized protein LOC133530682 n=1 Tax=Cydia pomonella TaxID=82600 RepID=UPI002ADD9C08|nr:uncharacterized protein LOC133530682 [Cydia pomonella]
MTCNQLLTRQQYAYQPGRSTVDAARDVVARVLQHLDDGRQVAAVFCDLSRAFEMIDHALLLDKLSRYGFTGSFYDTIASFLNNRRQCTCVHNSRSQMEPIGSCSVPQGSSTGNNLFLVLINDITSACDDPEYVMFVDDTCIIVNADNIDQLKSTLSMIMLKMSRWFSANGMLLNVDKTNIIHFKLKNKDNTQLDISINNVTVPQVQETRYLGFIIDSGSGLTWAPHIDQICNKVASACFALSRLAPTLSTNNLKKSYFGYFHSILIQGMDLWATSADRDRPFKLQKRALRIIARKTADHPARDLLRHFKILTLPSVYILTACLYVRANKHNYSAYGIRSDRCRARNLLAPPRRRLAKARASLSVFGPKIYNKIPIDIRNVGSDTIFKNKLKALLIKLACYDINELEIPKG